MSACRDNLGVQNWDATPDTITLFSLSNPDLLGFPSAYDFANRRPVAVERPGETGNWDVALATPGSGFQLVPSAAFQGVSSRAGIATITGQSFDALTEAPNDTSLFNAGAIPIQDGGVYVVRTRRVGCGFSTAVHYAKLKVVSLDATRGIAMFATVVNPLCNDRSFVPPED